MGLITIQDYEYPILADLLTTYELNASGKGMVLDLHHPFHRSPAPSIMNAEDDKRFSELEKKGRLAWAWESTLFQLDSTGRIYDGTSASAARFTDKTGLTPAEFAQAWLEIKGSLWRFYHASRSGEEVVEAMCAFWAAKVKHWRTIPEAEVQANIVNKTGSEGFAQIGRMVEHALPTIMGVNGERYEEHMIFRALKCKGSFDCTAQPMAPFCTCAKAFDMPVLYGINTKVPFIKSWHAKLLATDDAFLFNGASDIQSATLFKVRMGGRTPADFAHRFIDALPPFWEPATTKEALVETMLAYWLRCARNWRERCKTRREARTRAFVDQAAGGRMRKISFTDGSQQGVDPHENDREDELCRYVRFDDVPPRPGHRHTVVLYAKAERGGDGFGYEVVSVVPCHEGCAPPQNVQVDIWALTKAFVEEDIANARAVRPEW